MGTPTHIILWIIGLLCIIGAFMLHWLLGIIFLLGILTFLINLLIYYS